MAYDKHGRRQDRERLRQLFMREWDPIGVSEIPEASDEYDRYVGYTYVMLMDEHRSAAEIAAYLVEVETNYMGMTPRPDTPERARRTAELAFDMRDSFRATER